jgi:hypothetical protein
MFKLFITKDNVVSAKLVIAQAYCQKPLSVKVHLIML